MKRKICVVTGSRAEYGLLRPLLSRIKNDTTLSLQLVVTGMHLSRAFGNTYKAMRRDGFAIAYKVNSALDKDTAYAVSMSVGHTVQGFAKAYEKLRPDIVVVLGDRFEVLAAAIPAMIRKIPIAHIHGGEVTEGAFDDAIRHAITKMSALHFTSAEAYRRRVIQLGEQPSRVFNVGSLGVENIRTIPLLSQKELSAQLGITFGAKNVLVTFHPETLDQTSAGTQCQELFAALSTLRDTTIIFTKANADPGGRTINAMIDRYVKEHKVNTYAFTSLGQLRYLSMLRCVDAVVGNSSSGIIEAPSFGIGTINIGDRQTGRIKAPSVIDCAVEKNAIQRAFAKIYSPQFRRTLRTVRNPYEKKGTSEHMVRIVKEHDLHGSLKKKFYDLGPKRT